MLQGITKKIALLAILLCYFVYFSAIAKGQTNIVASATTICTGNNVVLTATGLPSNARVFWSTGDSATTTIVETPISSTTYTVSVYLGAVFHSTATILVNVVPNNLVLTTDKTSLCLAGDSARLTTSIGASCGVCVVNYYNSAGVLVGSRTGLPDAVGVRVAAGTYYARMNNCNTLSNTVSVSASPVNANIAYSPDTVLCGSSDSSALFASGYCSNCGFSWRRDGLTVAGATTNLLHATQSGNYQVSVSDLTTGCSSTANRTILSASGVLDTIVFFPVSTSETSVALDSLLNYVAPLASAALPRGYAGNHVSLQSGIYVFNANTAGVGTHAITVSIASGGCTSYRTAYINVVAAPSSFGLAGQYCSNVGTDTILRDPAFGYSASSTATLIVYNNEMSVSATNYSGTFSPQCGLAPASQCYIFDLAQTTGLTSVVTTLYWHRMEFYSGGVLTGTRSYIVGRTVDTISTSANAVVDILSADTLYCANIGYRAIQLTPSIGRFEIKQLNGTAPDSMRLVTNINSGVAVVDVDAIYGGENTNVAYRMYYIVGAVGCTTTDSLDFLIPQPADANFSAALNTTGSYCQSDEPDTLSPLALPQNRLNTSFFTINNVLAIDRIFDPLDNNKVFVGNNIIIHNIANAYGCVSTFRDTFVVNALPVPVFSALNSRYCVYENSVAVNATAIPVSGSGVLYLESNTIPRMVVTNPYILSPSMLGSSDVADNLVFTYVHTNSSGCVDSAIASTTINPRPYISLAPLEPVYCRNTSVTINLSPYPTGGNITRRKLSGSSNNTNVNAGAATYTLDNRLREEITYTYTSPATGCANVYRDTVEVVNSSFWSWADVNILAPATSFCFVDDTIEFYGTRNSAPGTPNFYTNATTPNGGIIYQNQDTARFVPNQASIGQLVLTFSVTNGGCALIEQRNIRVNPLPNLRIDYVAAAATYPAYQRQMFGDTALCEYSRSFVNVFNLNQSQSTSLLPAQFTYTGVGYTTNTAAGAVEFNSGSVPIINRIGFHAINIAHTDANGCSATAVDSIEILPNSAPEIVGVSPVYCVGSPSDTIFGLPANGTWSHVFTPTTPNPNPTFTMTVPNPNGVSPYAVLHPNATGTVDLYYNINNSNGCFNVRTNTFTIQPSLNIAIAAPASICANAPAATITATNSINNQNITNAINFVFYRNGTILPSAIFNDSMLNTTIGFNPNNNDTIVATYADAQSGCVDTAQVGIAILAAPNANIVFPTAAGPNSNIYCVDTTLGMTTMIQGSNNIGGITSGTFTSARNRLMPVSSTAANLRIDSIFTDTITYIVINNNACTDTTTRIVEVRGLPVGLVLAGVRPIYCQATDPINITGFPTPSPNDGIIGELSITNLTTNNTTNYGTNVIALPAIGSLGSIGNYRVSYTYSNEFGCASNIAADFTVHPNPVADFQQVGFCAGDTLQLTDASFFNNVYDSLDVLDRWIWLYNNQTTPDTNVVFFPPQIPNRYIAELTVVSQAGCTAQKLKVINIYKYPNVDFEMDGGCQGSPILFSMDSTGLNIGTDSLTYAIWDFGNGVVDTQNVIINSASQIRNTSHTYIQEGVLMPTLTLSNRGLCTATKTDRLVISPVIALQLATPNPPQPDIITNIPYYTNFEQNTGGWYAAQNEQVSDWHWGYAGTNGGSERINTRPATNPNRKVWTTSKGVSGADSTTTFNDFVGNEPSWVYSPCYDFTLSQRPMIKLDYITDMRTIVDGATMEYYDERINPNTNQKYGWRRFGDDQHGINWYNSTNLISLFGLPDLREYNLLHGWSDTIADWRTARYRLDQFRGKRDIRFRIAFAAAIPNNMGGATGQPFNGIAFDNVWIGERGRGVLIEHFTNDNILNMANINQHIYDLAFQDDNFQDITLIQYHTDVNGFDPYHAASAPNGGSARMLRYGISNTGDGRAIVDGNFWLGASQQLTPQVIEYQMLQDPYFNISGNGEPKITLNISTQSASLQAEVTAMQNLPVEQYFLYPVIVEDSIQSANTGLLRSVFRTFLPDAVAIRQWRAWGLGDQYSINETWSYNISDINPNKLKGVVFIQDSLGKVYHAVTTLNFDVRIVGVSQETEFEAAENAFSLKLYPNPTTDRATLQFDEPLNVDFDYQVFDMRGTQIQRGTIAQGTQQSELNVYDLPAGVYVVHLADKTNTVRIQRRLVVHKP
jgi:hypothetical protein